MHLIFADVETTGPEPQRDRVIEIGAVRVDADTLRLAGEPISGLSKMSLKVQFDDALMGEEAARINGYRREDWHDAVSLSTALDVFCALADGAILAGHNVAFDRAFLFAECARTGLGRPRFEGYRVIDIAAMSWGLVRAGLVESMSIAKTAELFGLEMPPHTALGDVLLELEVYRRLTQIFEVGLTAIGRDQLNGFGWLWPSRKRLDLGEGG